MYMIHNIIAMHCQKRIRLYRIVMSQRRTDFSVNQLSALLWSGYVILQLCVREAIDNSCEFRGSHGSAIVSISSFSLLADTGEPELRNPITRLEWNKNRQVQIVGGGVWEKFNQIGLLILNCGFQSEQNPFLY